MERWGMGGDGTAAVYGISTREEAAHGSGRPAASEVDAVSVLDISDEAASKATGLALRARLEELLSLKRGGIAVDFKGITRFAYPFFNYSFAALALVYGFDAVRAIQIRNLGPVGSGTYRASMENAEMVSRHQEHAVEAGQAVDDTPKKVMP